MDIKRSDLDFVGARGSNTGDMFHELWAVRHALRLLNATDGLTAVKVEGVPATGEPDRVWDGVDCTLLFGGENLVEAEQVELQQLKYSAAHPEKKWTVARVCRGKSRDPRTSLIRRLGTAYTALITSREGRQPDTAKISLVTNQPVSVELLQLMQSARDGVPACFAGSWRKGDPPLHRLVDASGLNPSDFSEFARVVDFRGETGSRFALEEGVLLTISEWSDTEFTEIASRLRRFVRDQMLPERAKELITKERVLIRFGVSDERALFPCPSAIKTVDDAVSRLVAAEVVTAMTADVLNICLHGGAGVGKTTVLQEIGDLLPNGSEMIVFDCYSAGSYMDASKLRHQPKDAFVQLSNEVSQRLGLPALLSSNARQNFARAFRQRLELAAKTLSTVVPEGLLVIAIDAADNSITAARARVPPETSFVTELMSIGDLPSNVRVIVSARTGRLEQLNAPSEFREIEIQAFRLEETVENVARYWDAPSAWIEDFHFLSGGVPRVQGYAFGRASDDWSVAVEYLKPAGKSLDEVFDDLLTGAQSKAGRSDVIQLLCAGLTVLPRPIPVAELAHITDISELDVLDFCTDLAPGVRTHEGFFSFTDEDFEAYVRDLGKRFKQSVQMKLAERLLENASRDEYAAFNVADQLLLAGKANELLELVTKEPEPSEKVIPDPVLRREVRNRRLVTAARVCREAGEIARALQFVLIAAEAVGSSKATRSLLAEFPKLTAKFARDIGGRLILGDPDYVSEHGRLLMSCLAEDAAKDDRVAVRENWRRLSAWFEAREDILKAGNSGPVPAQAWPINGDDVAASLLATAILQGADAAIAHFKAWRPFSFRIQAAKAFVARLLVESQYVLAEEVARKCRSWQSLFLLVPLARAGQGIDLDQLADSLKELKRRFPLDAAILKRSYEDSHTGPYVIDTVLSAAEILIGHNKYLKLSASVLAPFLDTDLRRIDKLHDFEVPLLDAILRSYCLNEAMNGNEVDVSRVLMARPNSENDNPRGNDKRHEDDHDRRLKEVMSVIAPVYAHRAKIMVDARHGEHQNVDLAVFPKSIGEWQLERSHYASTFRAMLGERLTDLVAIGANPSEVMIRALAFRRGFWPDAPGGVDELCNRLAAIPTLHGDLIAEISKAAERTSQEKIRAQERSNTLAAYATLLAPISSDDAKILFQKAVDVASELDLEAIDQLRLLNRLIENGRTAFGEDGRVHALMVAEIVRDAAIRLGDMDHFPWDEAMSSIARLDTGVAVASVARWDDSGIESINMTLAPVVECGLREGYFNGAQGAALIALDGRPPVDLFQHLLNEAKGESSDLATKLTEELAHDSVVGRIPYESSLEPLVAKHGKGKWAVEFKARAEFLSTSQDEKEARSQERKDPASGQAEFFAAHEWDLSRLLDADALLIYANEVLERLRDACQYGSLGQVLGDATGAVPPGKRTEYLEALAGMLALEPRRQVIETILRNLDSWKDQFAVAGWCKAKLPQLLAHHLPLFARYLPWDDEVIGLTMDLIKGSDGDPTPSLLEGIERNVEAMKAETIFALVGLIGSMLDPMDCADLGKWYVERLLARVPESDREAVVGEDIPLRAPEVVGRFLYAYMSDVDLRQRWRAAHALRRLARLGDGSILREAVAQYDRLEERAFRAMGQPFYWLAARLWLVIALDRIAGETADAVIPHANTLLEISYCENFPHLLIRDFAADACRRLVAAGHLKLDAEQMSKLDAVNAGLRSDKPRPWGRSKSLQWDSRAKAERRFDFDSLDTLPYWYDPWAGLFDGAAPDEFIRAAEEWIIDKWGVREKLSRRTEPRLHRFPDSLYGLWRHGHGSLPTLELYQTHLEWHAMWCAAGQLSKTYSVYCDEYGGGDSLRLRISDRKLTHPPYWMSDLAAPAPLQKHRRSSSDDEVEEWLCDIVDEDFLREMFPEDRAGWICVSTEFEVVTHDREEKVEICTGLVTPETACALVRALQTVGNKYQYRICPEGHDLEIDAPEYQLRGWLTGTETDLKFDKKDPYCHGAGCLYGLPGARVAQVLGLEKRYCGGRLKWYRDGADTASFVYEAWGPRNERARSVSRTGPDTYSGYRLLVRKDALAEFLQAEDRDLIAEIGITRNDRQGSRSSYDSEDTTRADYDRIVLLRKSGALEAAERGFEAWRSDSS